jgi:hypothetical protein
MGTVDTSYIPIALLDQIFPVAAIRRSVTDFTAIPSLIDIAEQTTTDLSARTAVVDEKSQTVASQDERQFVSKGSQGWLSATLATIAREFSDQADSLTRDRRATTEAVAFYLADMPFEYRPQLYVDEHGVPGFATASDAFYLHLTVDSPESLTWYSVQNDEETFVEAIRFDGKNLPRPLADLVGRFT